MKYEEFVEEVRRRAHLSSESEAIQATRATLETLAGYLTWKERHDAASQLPKVIKAYIEQPFVGPDNVPVYGPDESMTLDDFYLRVSIQEGVSLPVAIEHALAVLSVLRDALSAGELADLCAELPTDIVQEFFVA